MTFVWDPKSSLSKETWQGRSREEETNPFSVDVICDAKSSSTLIKFIEAILGPKKVPN